MDACTTAKGNFEKRSTKSAVTRCDENSRLNVDSNQIDFHQRRCLVLCNNRPNYKRFSSRQELADISIQQMLGYIDI